MATVNEKQPSEKVHTEGGIGEFIRRHKMITFLRQNKGTLAKRKRDQFPKLSDAQIEKIEKAFGEIFQP